jgi:hypothetical protein
MLFLGDYIVEKHHQFQPIWNELDFKNWNFT